MVAVGQRRGKATLPFTETHCTWSAYDEPRAQLRSDRLRRSERASGPVVQKFSPVSGFLGVVAMCWILDGWLFGTVDTCQARERKSWHARANPAFLARLDEEGGCVTDVPVTPLTVGGIAMIRTV